MKVKVPGVNSAEMSIRFLYYQNKIKCILIEEYAHIRIKRFSGVAKCHPDDKFDKAEGERIALNRALVKRTKYLKILINDVDKMFTKLINQGTEIATNKVERKWRHRKNRQERSYKNTNAVRIH